MVGLVEPMLKLHRTAGGLRLAAYGLGRMRRQRHAGAVSRKPMALPDALVYELRGLTEEGIRIVEGVEAGRSLRST